MLALAVCETCPPAEVDIVIPVLFNLFDTRASLMRLLKTMIDREVAHTGKAIHIFQRPASMVRRQRGRSVPTQLGLHSPAVGLREDTRLQLSARSHRTTRQGYDCDASGFEL